MLEPKPALLTDSDPAPVTVVNAEGAGPFFLTCDHAGNKIPLEKLGDLGVSESERQRHIAWDVGAEPVARRLSEQLDSPLVLQTYSRLVIDCNRRPYWPTAMPTVSELTEIPGNRGPYTRRTDPPEAREIFEPYHAEISPRGLDRRVYEGKPAVLVAMHSFTPVYKGVERPWHVGLLYNRDDRLAVILKDLIGKLIQRSAWAITSPTRSAMRATMASRFTASRGAFPTLSSRSVTT